MAFGRVLLILALLIAISQGENSTSTSTTTTTPTASTTPVPDRPIKEPGCYWTPCKSPLTYDLKCPPETEEQNQNDEMPCEGIFVKYQCCPRKDVDKPDTTKPAIVGGGESKVVPQGV